MPELRPCSHLTRAMLTAGQLYLGEVEQRTGCKARGCWGRVRIALPRRGDTSAFIGGMA